MKNALLGLCTFVGTVLAYGQTVSTFAHLGCSPENICNDPSGNLYISDKNNHVIKKITPDGTVSTFAGSGSTGNTDGTGINASFNAPQGICSDDEGNLYVADHNNFKIRKITPDGVVSTLAGSGTSGNTDGTGSAAQFSSPWGLLMSSSGDILVTDQWNFAIRKVTKAGVVTTFSNVGYVQLFNLCEDPSGNIYATWPGGNQIFKYDTAGAYIGVFAGSGTGGNTDGNGANASFYGPKGIVYSSDGYMYVTDNGGSRIRKIDSSANVTTIAGNGGIACTDGPANTANFWGPASICQGSDGALYIADYFCNSIRKLSGLSTDLLTYHSIDNEIKIFPNPVRDEISSISLPMFFTNYTLKIYDIQGHSIRNEDHTAPTIQIDLRGLQRGLYSIVVEDGIHKVIKKIQVID